MNDKTQHLSALEGGGKVQKKETSTLIDGKRQFSRFYVYNSLGDEKMLMIYFRLVQQFIRTSAMDNSNQR